MKDIPVIGVQTKLKKDKSAGTPYARGTGSVHELMNQLTVINLYCFKLRDRFKEIEASDQFSELQVIDLAVEQASILLETIKSLQ
jgi:hypothetical protein